MVKAHILDYFEETVENKRSSTAVCYNDSEISFQELKDQAQKLGIFLISAVKNVRNIPIAVFLPKNINTVIADLAILYSGNPFMNLDVKTPADRNRRIVELIKPALIVTDKKRSPLITSEVPVVLIDDIDLSGTVVDSELLGMIRNEIIDTDPFCIINTSGSTGTPKGVVLNFRSFFDFINVSNDRFGFNGSEIIGSLSPSVFDIYDFELCMLMVNGSRIVLLDSMLAAFPARLLENLVNSHVNFIFWVPSIMVNIANMGLLEKIQLPELKLIWFAGEVFPTKQFLIWYDNLPDATFANLYGPIEITLDCTYYVVDKRPLENEPLPIGIPYRNTDVLLLNEKKQRCVTNEEGELCIRGTSLAMGYYNNPEKTSAAFIQNPLNDSYPELIYCTGDMAYMREDGNLIFKGRKDSLIKHMGYRIELGEIEHTIENDLKLVKYCCVVYQYKKKEITLFYENDRDIPDKEFRVSISKKLPSYMIPSIYIRVEELPRNTNGKIDRLKLNNMVNKEGE